ncbi:hypothetical protein K502DRAFT_324455 [Neoconidiobolus thromboides FSU 785]|nr:hypothetical protein K502DRAFT_324455 [Neoconidiobolus thromboides FSU 785]
MSKGTYFYFLSNFSQLETEEIKKKIVKIRGVIIAKENTEQIEPYEYIDDIKYRDVTDEDLIRDTYERALNPYYDVESVIIMIINRDMYEKGYIRVVTNTTDEDEVKSIDKFKCKLENVWEILHIGSDLINEYLPSSINNLVKNGEWTSFLI